MEQILVSVNEFNYLKINIDYEITPNEEYAELASYDRINAIKTEIEEKVEH